jgi:hypothetical protein
MEEVIDNIVRFRKHICPRTNYLTGGDAAATLYVFKNQASALETAELQVVEKIIATKEFDRFQLHSNYSDLSDSLDQHVILTFSTFDTDSFASLKQKKTKLFCDMQFIETNPLPNNQLLTSSSIYQWNEKEEISLIQKYFPSSQVLLKFHFFQKIYQLKTKPVLTNQYLNQVLIGYNKQPAVTSRLQFRYIWNIWPKCVSTPLLPFIESPINLEETKLRVLQRLSDKPLHNPRKDGKEIKMSMKEWDLLITKALSTSDQNYADDWDIYSMIRERTLGSTLEKDTNPLSLLLPSSEQQATITGGGDSDERADFLVDRIIDCLPEPLRTQPEKHGIHSMLDYGCAEGGITAMLGQRLHLSSSQIYGADVRKIVQENNETSFQFLQLENENRESPFAIGSILPSLATGSTSFINASMVFHHIIHIDHVLLELRRILEVKKQKGQHSFLLIREHDCICPAIGCFLDIVHGLYSLAWQSPVEWPSFIEEYEAFYRNREDWNTLLGKYGFELYQAQTKSYDAATWSTWNPRKARFANVIKAYYALYAPKADFDLGFYLEPRNHRLITNSNNIAINIDHQEQENKSSLKRSRDENSDETLEESESNTKKKMKTDDSGEPSFDDFIICESKKYPGYFYKFYKYQDNTVWIDQPN